MSIAGNRYKKGMFILNDSPHFSKKFAQKSETRWEKSFNTILMEMLVRKIGSFSLFLVFAQRYFTD